MVDSKEKYKFDLGVKGLKLSWPVPFLFNFADVVCVGKIAAGNLNLYLPFLLKEIQANPKRQYLLLHSLKEVRKFIQKSM